MTDLGDVARTALPPGALPLLQLLCPGGWVLEPLPSEGDPATHGPREPTTDTADATRPVLRLPTDAPATLFLPPAAHSHWAASVAHAAAHRRFGGPLQPRRGLKPVQQALLGVLEDARVEWLACAELPGLRAWWLPSHSGDLARRGQG
ncbi:MAG: hypothetical protein WEK74_14255, partial [Hydrogenophaga sp.]